MTTLVDIVKALERCTAEKDGRSIARLAIELEVSSIEDDLTYSVVREICTLLQNPDFLTLEDSWLVLKFLYDNAGSLDSPSQLLLRKVAEESFDKFSNWMGAFVSAEILGEFFADDAALSVLIGLSRSARSPTRALVPHGLERLAKVTPDTELRRTAQEALEKLAADSDEQVRREAALSINALQK